MAIQKETAIWNINQMIKNIKQKYKNKTERDRFPVVVMRMF